MGGSRLRGGWLVLLGMVCLVPLVRAHEVDQMFAELRVGQEGWHLEVLFDAAYALPEMRADKAAPAPARSWLVGLGEDEHLRIREGAGLVLREDLEISWNSMPLTWEIHFPDFETEPPDFPVMRIDTAFTRVVISGHTPEGEGEFAIAVGDGEAPDYVIAVAGAASKRFLSAKPGAGEVVCWRREGSSDGQAAGASALWLGFLHVVPLGWDHSLFVLALFLARRSWRALLAQSLVFTVAHSITLGLVLLGGVALSGKPVEVAIALSIAVAALANLRTREVGLPRLVLVFVFGLVHGLGFGGALADRLRGAGLIDLVLANVGIELAQILVLVIAWVLTLRWSGGLAYRRVRVVASMAIGLVGLWLAASRALAGGV